VGHGTEAAQAAQAKEAGPRSIYRIVGIAFFALLVVVALASATVARRKGE